MSRLRNSYLGQAWLILLLAAVFGALLAAIHLELSPRIEENIRAEIMREIPGLLLGGEAVAGASITIDGDQVSVEPASGESTVPDRCRAAIRGLPRCTGSQKGTRRGDCWAGWHGARITATPMSSSCWWA